MFMITIKLPEEEEEVMYFKLSPMGRGKNANIEQFSLDPAMIHCLDEEISDQLKAIIGTNPHQNFSIYKCCLVLFYAWLKTRMLYVTLVYLNIFRFLHTL